MKFFSNTLFNKFREYDVIFLGSLLVCLFFYPLIFSDKTLFFRDIHRWFYPMKYFLATSLENGTIPYWCPYYFCGSPFMSDIQAGLFYPLSLVFALVPFPRSFNIYIGIHFLLAFCFFYLFIKEIGLSKKAALFTAISYCYGGFIIACVNTLNNLSTAIWLPAILWAFTKAINKGRKSWLFITTIFICMSILGGEPQLFILSAGLLLIYGFVTSSKTGSGLLCLGKDTGTIPLLIVIAGLITIVQLGPTYMDYQQSARLGGLTYKEAARFSLGWGTLKHLLLPLYFTSGFETEIGSLQKFFPDKGNMPWLLTFYPGFLIVPMALLGLFINFSKKNLVWFIIFFVSILLALGENTPFHYFFYIVFPFFRFPEKFIFLSSFCLLVMAAHGFDRIEIILKKRVAKTKFFIFFIFFVLIADLFSAHKNLNPFYDSSFYFYHHKALQPILDDPETFRVYIDSEMDTPAKIEHTILNHHIKWQMMLMPNLGIMHKVSHVGGIPALELKHQHQITEIFKKSWSDKIRFLKMANVKYIVSAERLDGIPALQGQVEKINALLYKVTGFLPRAFLIGNLEQDKTRSMNALFDHPFDIRKSALTSEEALVRKYKTPFLKKVEALNIDANGGFQIELNSEKKGVLVVSESLYPGWRVFVDGEKKKLIQINLFFQGVELEKGRHSVSFMYRPKNFTLFLSVSSISLTVFLLFWLYYHFFGSKRLKRN